MKNGRKISFILMMTVGILGSITFGYTQEQEDAYQWARAREITTTNSIEQADMEGSLTRIAMAKMISQYAINILEKIPDLSQDCQFSDVDTKLDESYNRGVTLSCQLGLMGKGGKFFNPHKTVTRAELGTVLSRLLYGLEDGNPYYLPHLEKLKDEGIIKNDDPNLKEQRGYFMLMLMRSQGKGDKITSSEQALQIMLKELNLEEERKNIERFDCSFEDPSSNSFLTYAFYDCSFLYQGKRFQSRIKAKNGEFVSIEKIKNGYGGAKEADKNGKNVLIYEILSSEEQKEIKEIIENYYHFDDTKREMGTLGEEGNTLVMCYKSYYEKNQEELIKKFLHISIPKV